MSETAITRPDPSAVLELFKPVTWFPPVWAFLCGVVASGAPMSGKWGFAALGLLLAGPMVCATSQAVNDWFDRHVDAINEPHRPIPSGRIPGRLGLYIAIFWSFASLLVGATLGTWGFAATVVALALAWAYSAPPLRLKLNGWWGNLACGLSYESLPWITAAAVISGGAPALPVIVMALLYGLGAHGIMTLNDFKSIEGDTRTGVRSLPVQLGAERAALVACWMMAVPQLVVIGLLFAWGTPIHAGVVILLLAGQVAAMVKMLRDPKALAPWYNATGIGMYVLGMLATAFALRGIA
ncbi:chlorophyll synthase ChlG [Roseococcus sp. SDR]|uniref:chlorophyll synthase ChlG n=1 Tax=Roseococcus sp. SDR TaxID=2835532 RepID=UPI001BCD0A88|nr:chlorophyll synthase ChlG [Roseococcus sp. SDR]MBS7789899.1 chlorophyll synthase ChlG [Roseococcus sp. SDR]MBV1845213.1 chlorophyll synthase ChlG [Roseococcus sp. SDR]